MTTTPMDFVKICNSMFRRDAITAICIDDDGHNSLIVVCGIIQQFVSTFDTLEEAEIARNDLFLKIALVAEETNDGSEEWEVWIDSVVDGRLIYVIKEVRSLTNLGLKEAKDIVDLARSTGPQKVRAYPTNHDALWARGMLETAGCVVSIR